LTCSSAEPIPAFKFELSGKKMELLGSLQMQDFAHFQS